MQEPSRLDRALSPPLNVIGDLHPLQPPKLPATKKRKKPDDANGPPTHLTSTSHNPDPHPEPRRLRRLHEACARCRRKKIKCDSMLPDCGACQAAGVQCTQEDRHRQTLKPRGYTDQLEAQIQKCTVLLAKFIPGFKIEYLDYHLNALNVPFPSPSHDHSHEYNLPPYSAAPQQQHQQQHQQQQQQQQPRGPGVPHPSGPPGLTGAGATPEDLQHPTYSSEAGPYSEQISQAQNVITSARPSFDASPQRDLSGKSSPGQQSTQLKERKSMKDLIDPAMLDDKGRDPNGNDMSAFAGLVRGFGVGKVYAKGVKPEPPVREDVIGGIGMSRPNTFSKPHNPSHWTSVGLRRDSPSSNIQDFKFPLPRDRRLAQRVLDCYFDKLNPHRPVFMRREFMSQVDSLYDSLEPDGEKRKLQDDKYKDLVNDAGFLCSVYLVFALGTMAVRNRRVHGSENGDDVEEHWPSHEYFYDLALVLKPDLANSISTLQALILLHWYLYCERHGKALWRLVGNLVRLAIELGLHHDPSEQAGTFTFEERQLRAQLWYICLVHDRGTSIMFGRPLAVQQADYRIPFPTRCFPSPGGTEPLSFFSEDFDLSKGLMDIQGEIVNLLLRPGKLTGEQLILHAVEIERLLEDWRQTMPPNYKRWFGASSMFRTNPTTDGSDELLADVTVDGGLVMLKYTILRMFLLRTVFMNTLVKTSIRFNALRDAVITAHNVLAFHACLVHAPDVAFFVSPIPIQMTAMTILYARFSKVEALDPAIAKEDCALALKLVPELRWRWERQDNKGSHPLIARLAYKLLDGFNENPKAKPWLIDELYWVPHHILHSRASPNIEELLQSPPHVNAPLPPTDESGAGPRVISIPSQTGQGPQPQHYQTVQPVTQTPTSVVGPSPTSSSMAPSSSSMSNVPHLVDFDQFSQVHYFPDASAAPGRLMNELAYQHAPTTYNLQHVAMSADGMLEHQHATRAAAGHVPGGADPDEKYEIWQSRHTYDPYHRPHEY